MSPAIPNASARMRPSGQLVGFGQSYAQATARRQLRASLALVGLFAAATTGTFAFASYDAMRSSDATGGAMISTAFAGELSRAAPLNFAGTPPSAR